MQGSLEDLHTPCSSTLLVRVADVSSFQANFHRNCESDRPLHVRLHLGPHLQLFSTLNKETYLTLDCRTSTLLSREWAVGPRARVKVKYLTTSMQGPSVLRQRINSSPRSLEELLLWPRTGISIMILIVFRIGA